MTTTNEPIEAHATLTDPQDGEKVGKFEPDFTALGREPADVPPETAPMAVERYVPDVPLVPYRSEIEALAQMATSLSAAGALPVPLRNKPNDVFLVLLTARDLGVSPTVAIRECHVIEGRITVSPKLKMAMVNERGRVEGWSVWPDPENGPHFATWYASRRDRIGADGKPLVFRSTFSWAEAQRIPKMADHRCESADVHHAQCKCKQNWANYGKRMLSWRALGFLMDDVFPEVGTGLYSPDEMGAITDDDGRVIIDVTSGEVLPGMNEPRRAGQAPEAPTWEPVSDEDREALSARVALIVTVPDAASALRALWTEKHEGSDLPRLPPLQHEAFGARDVAVAGAMITSIEKRLRAGEWGVWEADPIRVQDAAAESPATAPLSALEGAQSADGTADSAEPEPDAAPLNPLDAIKAEVGAWDVVKVTAEADRLGVAPGPPKVRRDMLVLALMDERHPPKVKPEALLAARGIVDELGMDDVVAELTERGLPAAGNLVDLRMRLAIAMAEDTTP